MCLQQFHADALLAAPNGETQCIDLSVTKMVQNSLIGAPKPALAMIKILAAEVAEPLIQKP